MTRIQRGAAAAAVVALAAVALAWGAARAGGNAGEWREVFDPNTRMLQKTFTLDKGTRLEVTVGDADVDLSQGTGRAASVEVYAEGPNRDSAREHFEDMHWDVTLDNGVLAVRTRGRGTGWSWHWFGHEEHVRIRCRIVVPKGTDMRVRGGDGDIKGTGLTGRLEARSSDGAIVIDNVKGPKVSLHSSDGAITVDRVEADDVDIVTSDGNVDIKAVTGKRISATTSDGDLSLGRVNGDDVDLHTSDGDIRITVSGGSLRARASDGDMSLSLAGDTEVDARTSDGDIEIEAPQSLRANLRLSGDHVNISGGVTIDGDITGSHVEGAVGGGGKTIRARASDGRVSFVLR